MLKGERQEKILDILNEEKKVIATELSIRLDVSEDTIRRDLNELDQQKLLKRVHSGALCIGPPVTHFQNRQKINNELKTALASEVIPLLKKNSVIIIDGGTTNLHTVAQIPHDFKCTVITNSPPVSQQLMNHKDIEVIVLGGVLYKESLVTLGVDLFKYLDNIRADTYLMGIHNINLQDGASVPTLLEAQIKEKMASISTEVIGVFTSNKTETISTHVICPINSFTHLITNNLSDKLCSDYQKSGVNITSINH